MAQANFANRTPYHGDNLKFLRGLNTATVNLIATDPPFNKSKDFHATPTSLAKGASFTDRWSWDRDVHPDWVDAIKDDWPAAWTAIAAARQIAGEDMGAFLCWLGVRLMEMHRVLADDGSLYLHIDHTAHAYAKTLLDAIFGRENFRNEVLWSYRTGGAGRTSFSRKHDTLLWYSMSKHYTFNIQKEKAYTKSRSRRPGIVNYGGGEAEFFEDKDGVYNLVNMRDVWEVPYIGSTDAERTGYPTQKPLALYERIIRASSNPGDVVLDPFCGCATTAVAAERLGRQWIGMDIWEGAYGQVLKRLQDNRQLLQDIPGQVLRVTTPPERTDDQKVAAPTLTLKVQIPEPPGVKMTNAQMKAMLVQNNGIVCAGCDRRFDDDRYLQLDHNTPRSGGRAPPHQQPDAPVRAVQLGQEQHPDADGFEATQREERMDGEGGRGQPMTPTPTPIPVAPMVEDPCNADLTGPLVWMTVATIVFGLLLLGLVPRSARAEVLLLVPTAWAVIVVVALVLRAGLCAG